MTSTTPTLHATDIVRGLYGDIVRGLHGDIVRGLHGDIVRGPRGDIVRAVHATADSTALVASVDRLALQLREFSTLQTAILGVEAVTVILGLAIAYVAVQGYRRNESRAMLFVATGFVLLVGVPGVLSIAFLAGLLPQTALAITGSVSEVLAMASILYGLRQPRRG